MDLVLQLLFTGIGIGSVYALVALGFVLIFRATNVVNFAQGEFSMVAAFLMVVFSLKLGLPYWIAFIFALLGMALRAPSSTSRSTIRCGTAPICRSSSRRSAPRSSWPIRRSPFTAPNPRCSRAGSRRRASWSGRSISTANIS
jgi:hypothetical protein